MTYLASRQIGIDMGHRVPDHGSKCRNLHGHRYTIEAILQSSELHASGEQKGMVLDFGFLKQLMVEKIEGVFDHALCLAWDDPLLDMFGVNLTEPPKHFRDYLVRGCRVILIDRTPTAENLAALWWELLEAPVRAMSKDLCFLQSVKVWETPNCWASYP
jgi:6-pyruvoyltetrahydropterin/6-carboxytetrahydropterin synthase